MRNGALTKALRRLDLAVGALEATAGRMAEAGREGADRDDEISLLSDDRARLAGELDQLNARAVRLEAINRDVARRLDTAIDAIRGALAQEERAEDEEEDEGDPEEEDPEEEEEDPEEEEEEDEEESEEEDEEDEDSDEEVSEDEDEEEDGDED